MYFNPLTRFVNELYNSESDLCLLLFTPTGDLTVSITSLWRGNADILRFLP